MKDRDSLDPPVILRATLHADGGSRGNPGESGIGYVLEAADVQGVPYTVSCGGFYIGQATNNQAEYHALIWGIENALFKRVRMLTIEMDSELVVKQIKGQYRVKNAQLKPLYQFVLQLLQGFYSYEIRHVYRSENSMSDKLANQAMDARQSVGNYDVEYVVMNATSEQGLNL